MSTRTELDRHYLIASDFDQTLSFNDSGLVLSEMLGVTSFAEKVEGLSKISLVQQGAELAYLLRHDPEFRQVRREHLVAAGKKIRLKQNVKLLVESLKEGLDTFVSPEAERPAPAEDGTSARFSFYVISASPQEVVQSALEGIVAPDHIFGTQFEYDAANGEICAIHRVPAGFGKVKVLMALETALHTRPDHTVYIGDGSSDLFVMQHVNGCDGYTIAVSEAKFLTRVARRTVLSENALSVLVPILEDILQWETAEIRELFSAHGLTLQEWNKIRTDWLTFHAAPEGLVA
ncbi:MAG: haloacid dehalogenase-like hydrolase [Terriglobales bacterium]